MNNLRKNQKGMISITTTVVLMIVITITVLSFAQIVRREQRQALDNQLSDQAFYAAESGINQARKYIFDTWVTNGLIPPDKTDCKSNTDYPATALPTDISADGTSFSCLLVNGSPQSLKYDLSPTAASKVFQLNANGTSIKTIDVAWTPSTNSAPRTGCPATTTAVTQLPSATGWTCNGYGILRLDLVPVDTMSRNGFMRDMFTAFISPANITGTRTVSYLGTGTNINGGLANQGARPVASCDDSTCKITINNLSATRYYARISTMYRQSSVTFAPKDALGNPVGLIGAQLMLDATGRAQDVLRRVQVRVPLEYDGFHPDYGIESTDSMCKLFTTFPGYGNGSTCL